MFYYIVMKIKSHTALITGASGKLGYQIALAMAEKGCNCICHYHKNEADAYALVEKIESLGCKAYSIGADLRDIEGIEKLFAVPLTPTILINSAAVFERSKIHETTIEQVRKTFEVNTVAPLMIIGSFVNSLEQAKIDCGKIVNIADVGGHASWSQFSAYCGSKAALISMTKSLAKELAPKIAVNSVSPGYIDLHDQPEMDEITRHISRIPMKRLARAEEVISAIMFLLENDYITGENINVDGGEYI